VPDFAEYHGACYCVTVFICAVVQCLYCQIRLVYFIDDSVGFIALSQYCAFIEFRGCE